MSFFWFSPTTSLVLVPVGSVDVPFIFEEVTADFQSVTVQDQLTYRIEVAKKLASMMNFTLAPDAREYVSDAPQKLPMRVINHARVLTRASLKSLSLRDTLGLSESLVAELWGGLVGTEAISALGIEILGLSILAIKPTPETARALEAEAREMVLREADESVYARRNAAIEQERAIKETQVESEKSVQIKKREPREAEMAANLRRTPARSGISVFHPIS